MYLNASNYAINYNSTAADSSGRKGYDIFRPEGSSCIPVWTLYGVVPTLVQHSTTHFREIKRPGGFDLPNR